jgi:peptidoglycan/LPS O-acetylase OafA/YrhL
MDEASRRWARTLWTRNVYNHSDRHFRLVASTPLGPRPSFLGSREGMAEHHGGRIRVLDGLRGVAILLVVLDHSAWPIAKLGGPCGVTLFFVLSGFLITRVVQTEIDRTGRLSYRNFYQRRALRLLPALLLLLAMYVPTALLLGEPAPTIAQATLAGLFYFNNLTVLMPGWSAGYLGHLWSLSMEEQFYLLWPALLVLLLAGRKKWSLYLVLVAAAASLIDRFLFGWSDATAYRYAYYLPIPNAWALLLGAALAMALRRGLRAAPSSWIGASALTGLLLTSSVLGLVHGLHSGNNYGMRLVCGPIAGAFSVVLLWAVTTRRTRLNALLEHRWLVFFGTISYGLYLWHSLLTAVLAALVPGREVVNVIRSSSAAVLAVGAAWLSFTYVETPFLRWKRSFAPVELASQDPGPETRPA